MCVFLSNLAAIYYMRIWFKIEKDWISNNSCRAWSSVGLETGCRRPFEIPRHTLMSVSVGFSDWDNGASHVWILRIWNLFNLVIWLILYVFISNYYLKYNVHYYHLKYNVPRYPSCIRTLLSVQLSICLSVSLSLFFLSLSCLIDCFPFLSIFF